MDATDTAIGGNGGLTQRWNLTKDGKSVDMEGPLYCDILQQKHLFLHNIPIRIKLTPASNAFALMGEGRVVIDEALLWVCHVDLSPDIYTNIAKKLQKDTVKYWYFLLVGWTMNRALKKLTCLVLLLFAGCGSQYPSVSGTVSLDGKPAAGVNVLFVPVSTKENPFPGPFAEATTDENGRYTLVTRDGSKGATPGMNVVEFYSVELIQNEFQDSSLQDLIGQSENGAKSNSAPKTKKK